VLALFELKREVDFSLNLTNLSHETFHFSKQKRKCDRIGCHINKFFAQKILFFISKIKQLFFLIIMPENLSQTLK
jgi:hypothetical protein